MLDKYIAVLLISCHLPKRSRYHEGIPNFLYDHTITSFTLDT